MGDVYFDTTAVAERAFGEPAAQLFVEELLAENRGLVTRYVREQYKSTFVRALVLVHNRFILHSRNEPDTAEGLIRASGRVLGELQNYEIAQPGDRNRAVTIIAALFRSARSTRSLLNTLERLLEAESETTFEGMLTVDETACCLCDPEPRKDDAGLFQLRKSCRKAPKRPCDIEGFWEKRSERLLSISRLEQPRSEHVVRARDTARHVTGEEAAPRGLNCWAHLSDAVIAAEMEPHSSIVTTDVDDFTELTQAIGEKLSVVAVPRPPKTT